MNTEASLELCRECLIFPGFLFTSHEKKLEKLEMLSRFNRAFF